MSYKIYGGLDVKGILTIGDYNMPFKKGDNNTILSISGGQLKWLTAESANLVTYNVLNSALNDTSAASICAANAFTINAINNIGSTVVGITGLDGIEVTQVAQNQFIISLYTPLTVNFNVSPSTFEIGQSVSACNFTWSYNKNVISQSIDQGIGTIDSSARSYAYTTGTPITANKTFTITGNDGVGTAADPASITFYNRRYYGTFGSDAYLTEADIKNLSSELSNSRSKTFSNISGNGERFVFAYPKSLGLATVKDGNNFTYQDWFSLTSGTINPYEVNVTNTYGITITYYVYQTFNRYNGLVTFIFS